MICKFAVKGMGVVLTIVLVTGCWDSREINDLSLITAAAVDTGKDKKFAVTFQWFNPTASSNGKGTTPSQTPVSSYTLEGNSITEAESELTKLSARIPDYSHVQVFVIGNELAKKGIKEVLERFGKEAQLRRSKYLLIAEKKGKDILSSQTLFEMPSADLREILEMTNQTSNYYVVDYNDFMAMYLDPDQLSFLPIVHAISSKGLEGAKTNKEKRLLEIEGMAFFKKDRMIARLNGDETRAWLLAQGKITKRTYIQMTESEQNTVVFQSLSQSRKLNIDISSDPIGVTLNIHTSGVVTETSGTKDLSQPKNLQKVEEQLEATIKNQIEKLIRKSQQQKIDILLLGREIRSYHPDKWNELVKNWGDYYSSAKFQVEVNVDIKNTGRLKK